MTLDGYPAVVQMAATKVTRRMNQLRQLLEVLAERGDAGACTINLCHHDMAYVER
jgi:hypothetical protein